ncbi:MAG: hypothetical protein WCL10_10380 [Novosphingobium sp.]|jgi:hypothetical protein|uniref:hypothetical protein n=1 Tax=Novosphingobium sp. TaxID=1874826 RepID=UPI00301B4C55
MSFTSAIVAIVAIIVFAQLRSARYRAERGHPLADQREVISASPALEREVGELRKRIEVLERIITDERESRRLAQDIEALREH